MSSNFINGSVVLSAGGGIVGHSFGCGRLPWYAGGAEQEAPYFLGYVEGRNIKFEHRFPNEIPNRNGGRP